MTKLAIAIFIAFASSALAQDANGVFEQFKKCKSKEESEIIACVSGLTSEAAGKRLNQRIAFWLHNLDELGKLEECPKDQLRLFPKASAKEYKALMCAGFKSEGASGKALFYFVDQAGLIKIDGVQFMRAKL